MKRKQTGKAGTSKTPPNKRADRKEEDAERTDALKASREGFLLIKDTSEQLMDTIHRATEGYEWMVGVLPDACAEARGVEPEALLGFLKHNMSNWKV